MGNKYGKTPRQKLEQALNQPQQTNAQFGNEALSLKDALSIIISELKKDKLPGSYFCSWKDNIAMAFVDELENYSKNIVGRNSVYEYRKEIANQAAINFLESLCMNQK